MLPIPSLVKIKTFLIVGGVLVLLLSASSAVAYWQIKKNGEYRAVNAQLKQDLDDEVTKNLQLHEQRKNAEALAAATIKNQRNIIENLNSRLTVISKIERDNPDVKEYMDQPIPDILFNELRGSAGQD